MCNSRSFAQLEENPNTTADEVRETLSNYVGCGAAIIGEVVINLVRKTKPSTQEIASMVAEAKIGFWDQAKRGFHHDADEYKKLALYLILMQ